jgi:HSP20 family protein
MSLLHRSKTKADPATTGAMPAATQVESAEPAETVEPVAPATPLPTLWSSWFDDGSPHIEERREDGQIVVRFEMPGLDPDKDVEITVADGILRIRAEQREETKGDDGTGYRSEYRYGSFARAVTLPPGAGEDAVKATYRDGVLEVRVPVDEETAAAKRIPITKV